VPRDLRLASTAADLALTLGLAAEARRYLAALDQALLDEAQGAGTDAETQRWWRERRAGLAALAQEAEAALAARDGALRRARFVGGGLLALAIGVFVVLLLAPGHGRGRDRAPHAP